MKYFLPIIIVVSVVFVSGCGITFTSRTLKDGGVFKSTDGAEQWTQKVFVSTIKKKTTTISDDNVARIVFAPHSNTEITLPTLNDGLYRTTDAGETWSRLGFGKGTFTDFAYDATNPATQYTVAGNTVYKSADAGATWKTVYTETRGEQMTSVAVDSYDPTKIYAGTSGGTILKSVNAGTDWSELTDINDSIQTIQISPEDTRILYATTPNKGISKSSDGGVQWSALDKLAAFGGGSQVHQLLLSGTPGRLYAATNNGLLRSNDSGVTWERLKTLVPENTLPIQTVAVDPNKASTIYFSVNNIIHKSEDGGESWHTIATVKTVRRITTMVADPTVSGTLYLGTMKVKR